MSKQLLTLGKPGISFLVLILPLFLLTRCSSDAKENEEEVTEVVETPEPAPAVAEKPVQKVTMVTEREHLKEKHKAMAQKAEQEPEQYQNVQHEEIVVAKTKTSKKPVIFVPHRTTYTPIPEIETAALEDIEPEEAHRLLTQFDVPPMYGYEECQDKKHMDHCMHMHLQRYLAQNLDRDAIPDDETDHVEFVTFIVQKDGTVDPANIEVMDQDPHCETCAVEAIRLVSNLSGWKPAIWNGEAVDARVTLPVRFHEYTM